MFYKEANFKETPIGKIPKEWDVTNLESIAKISSGNTAPQDEKYFRNGKYPFIRVQHLTELQEQKYPVKCDYINDYAVSNLRLKKFKKGSIIFPKSGESIKLEKRAILKEDSYVVNHLAVIEPFDKNTDNLFLFYYLCTVKTSNYLTKTTMPSLNLSTISDFLIPLPSLQEQQKIAEILSTVDKAIQKTNEIIAKTERLKKGLMQELLTKGIGHKEFKDTEIGRIPKDWEVVKLGNKEFAEIIMGQSPPSSTYNREGKGLPFLQGKMEFGDIHPSPILYCSQPIKIAEPNDILISVRAPVGDVNVAPYRLCIGRGLAAIRFNLNKACHWFYFYYFQKIKNFLENLGKGSTFKAITKEDLENLKVPYPSLFEQQKIAEILFTIDKKLEIERNEKVKLEKIKQGLMDLLLTGKVRVKVN
jgi:type I restriction enzyme S subunit